MRGETCYYRATWRAVCRVGNSDVSIQLIVVVVGVCCCVVVGVIVGVVKYVPFIVLGKDSLL